MNTTTYYYAAFSYDEIPNYADPLTAEAMPGEVAAPAAASDFTAAAGFAMADLGWANPVDEDFAGVVVRRSTSEYPATESEGDLAYEGTGTTLEDADLEGGVKYYYAVFAHDEVPNYSAAATATPTGHWARTYGGTGADYALRVRETFDGGYLMIGTTESSGVVGIDAWVLRLLPDGSCPPLDTVTSMVPLATSTRIPTPWCPGPPPRCPRRRTPRRGPAWPGGSARTSARFA